MALLFSNEILNAVDEELRCAQDSVQIITAYCKQKAFIHLDKCINENVRAKRLLVRFRMDDIVKGSTDFDVIEYAMKNGWEVYIRFDLHAKTYIVDNKRGLVSSANVTNSGLSIGVCGNMEMGTLVDIELDDIDKVKKLYKDAILINEEILAVLKENLLKVDKIDSNNTYSWDKKITELFNPHIETLFSYELPDKVDFNPGEYIAFLDETFTGDKEKIKSSFRWSNAYLWLLDILKENDGCMYFGAITQKLHEALISDPKPYRRDVKEMLKNFLSMIEMLEMDEIVIDKPNYSQRVRICSEENEL